MRIVIGLILFIITVGDFSYAQQHNAEFVGLMRNAYTSSSRFTNQLGYDWVNGRFTALYRAGPEEEYTNQGNGSLVISTSTDRGATWSKTSPNDIFNADLPGNIPGYEFSARHPSLLSYRAGSGTGIATLWGNLIASPNSQNGIFGEIAYKAGLIGGPYAAGILERSSVKQYFPSRIVRSMDGTMYSMFQSISLDNDSVTGQFFVMQSSNNGAEWLVDYNTPVLEQSELPNGYVFSEEAISMEVSPDGTVLYIGFVAHVPTVFPEPVRETLFGWVRSTDRGAHWTEPVLSPLTEWNIVNAPSGGIDQHNGWVYPAIATVVDGLNRPHFLATIDGGESILPIDSILIGEITIDETNPTRPDFWTLSTVKLPEFYRKINPRGATMGPQPAFIIRSEPEWSKSPDGMQLIAKWIDADSLFVATPAGHASAVVRDSTHDIYVLGKDLFNVANGTRGWAYQTDGAAFNVSKSYRWNEKFTKMNPVFNPENGRLGIIYTIMAEFYQGPNYYLPDIDDLGPAELFFIAVKPKGDIWPNSSNPVAASEGFALEQNYPNPFNPTTAIRFSVAMAGNATVRVFNMLGKELAVAFRGHVEAGSTTVTFDAKDLPSGQYMYRLESNGQVQSNIMTLMK